MPSTRKATKKTVRKSTRTSTTKKTGVARAAATARRPAAAAPVAGATTIPRIVLAVFDAAEEGEPRELLAALRNLEPKVLC